MEFQINREIEDDYFQNYKITLNDGDIIQFTTTLKGVERVRDYIVNSGVKVTNGRWRLKDGYKEVATAAFSNFIYSTIKRGYEEFKK